MALRIDRRPISLKLLIYFLIFSWVIIAAFPFIWTVWGSFKVELDFYLHFIPAIARSTSTTGQPAAHSTSSTHTASSAASVLDTNAPKFVGGKKTSSGGGSSKIPAQQIKAPSKTADSLYTSRVSRRQQITSEEGGEEAPPPAPAAPPPPVPKPEPPPAPRARTEDFGADDDMDIGDFV